MRIIAGEHRGRPILQPLRSTTRPITDRAKQSLFDILAPSIPDANVLDLFSGTGSMGLECLSRGARQVIFFEADRSALSLLKRNIATLNVGDRSRVVGGDLFTYFQSHVPPNGPAADLIFLDPPYPFVRERPAELQALAARLASRLSPNGMVIFRHFSQDQLALPPLVKADERLYGQMQIDFLVLAAEGS